MKTDTRKAITLVETLIAVAISAIIAVNAFTLYRSGVRSSISGVVSLDMLAEGKRILKQINDDLKNSCIPYHGGFSVSFNDLLQIAFSKNRGLEGAEFSLLRFKPEPDFARTGLPGPDYLLRPLMSIKYRLEKIENSELLRLVREAPSGDAAADRKILSERVSFFKISPAAISTPNSEQNWFWNVSLQLAGRTEKHAGQTQTAVSATARGEDTMNFYDIVYSDFFSAINSFRHSPRNWNTGLRYIPE